MLSISKGSCNIARENEAEIFNQNLQLCHGGVGSLNEIRKHPHIDGLGDDVGQHVVCICNDIRHSSESRR